MSCCTHRSEPRNEPDEPEQVVQVLSQFDAWAAEQQSNAALSSERSQEHTAAMPAASIPSGQVPSVDPSMHDSLAQKLRARPTESSLLSGRVSQMESLMQKHVNELLERVSQQEEAQSHIQERVQEIQKTLEGVLISNRAGLDDNITRPPATSMDAMKVQLKNELLDELRTTLQGSVPRAQEVADPSTDPALEMCAPEPSQISELETHDYTLTSSVWDLSCFIGRQEVGLGGSIMTIMFYALNLCIQVSFCIFCQQYFVGNDFSDEAIKGLDDFRLSSAHSFRFGDQMFDRTLIQQICNENAKYAQNLMLYAARQLEVRNTIEDYLKDDANGFLSMFSGQTMCVLARACWSLSVQGALNTNWRFFGVIFRIPRGPHTVIKLNELTRLGVGRLWLIVAIKIQEIAIAMFLLIYGCIWLSYTSQVEDLLLNAAALEFVMSVDERIFTAMAPRQATTFIESMQPLLVTKKSLCRFGIDSVALLSWLFLFAVVSIFHRFYVSPMVDQMQAAKNALCAYELGFTYAFDVHNILWVHRTSTPQSLARKERVQNAAQLSLRNVIRNWPTINKSLTIGVPNANIGVQSLDTIAAVGLSTYPDLVNPTCIDRIILTDFYTFPPQEQSMSAAFLYYLRLYTNNNSIRNCEDFLSIGGCSIVDHPGIAICSQSCCSSPTSKVFSHKPIHGCPNGCLQSVEYKSKLAQLRPSCTDFTLQELQNSAFWYGWTQQMVQYANVTGTRALAADFNGNGCSSLQLMPLPDQRSLCFGLAGIGLRPLSPICPQTCRCANSTNPHCAPACTSPSPTPPASPSPGTSPP